MSETAKRTSTRRVLDVLGEVVLAPQAATALYLSNTLDIPLPTVYRQLEALVDENFIAVSPSGTYVAGARLRSMMLSGLQHEPQVTRRRVVLQKLAAELDETVSLSVPNGESMIYFDRFESHWPLQNQLKVGDQLPLICSASGKLYLSTFDRKAALQIFKRTRINRKAVNLITTQRQFSLELDQIQARGYAFDNQEWFTGMIGASVPIYNREGTLCSCVSTHSLAARKTMSDLGKKIPLMQDAAKTLAEILLSDG